MLDTFEIYNTLKEDLPESVASKLATIMGKIYTELSNTVTKVEFNELREVVRELAEAQKRTEARVEELGEAQKRTEERVEELAEAQKRTEKRVEELAEAQKRTEKRVEELAEAQKETQKEVSRLDMALKELADAQRKTEEEVKKLAKGLRETREMVGGLSDTVGYSLEDKIFPYMERFARKEYGFKIDILDRRNIVYPDGKFDEVNIYAEGRRNGEKIYLIGECKSRPGKKEIKKFSDRLKRIKKHLGGKVEAFLVGYYYSPEIEKYLKENHPEIKVMKSFEFEMKYSGKR
ncbi:MAG: hypothetical protein D6726_04860 [Nitrospirae bacterium]|nr:MAG: hypothetical protein D6726_04860 [Nitrospirota bacterium]